MGERVAGGNSSAHRMIEYLNHRYGLQLQPCSDQEDMVDKLDFHDPKIGTVQAKVRDQRSDFIFESHKFLFEGNAPTRETKFKRAPGRDAMSKADKYICKPREFDPERINIAPASEIKRLSEAAHAEWDESITDFAVYCAWKRANFNDNRQCLMFHGENNVEIVFKIEEGEDRKTYGKFLVFIPTSAVKGCKSVIVRPGEEIGRPETWLPKTI